MRDALGEGCVVVAAGGEKSAQPHRRLGRVKAEYRSVSGLVKSAWRYEGDEWVWEFSVPKESVAQVTLPGETESKDFPPGFHTIRRSCR